MSNLKKSLCQTGTVRTTVRTRKHVRNKKLHTIIGGMTGMMTLSNTITEIDGKKAGLQDIASDDGNFGKFGGDSAEDDLATEGRHLLFASLPKHLKKHPAKKNPPPSDTSETLTDTTGTGLTSDTDTTGTDTNDSWATVETPVDPPSGDEPLSLDSGSSSSSAPTTPSDSTPAVTPVNDEVKAAGVALPAAWVKPAAVTPAESEPTMIPTVSLSLSIIFTWNVYEYNFHWGCLRVLTMIFFHLGCLRVLTMIFFSLGMFTSIDYDFFFTWNHCLRVLTMTNFESS